jgi:chaperonin GroEL
MTIVKRPTVVFQPDLIGGINVIADLVKPTLGPLPRGVAVESDGSRNRAPDWLDDASLAARRVIEISHPTANVGAMMMRHAMWRMRETVGDGSATMAVIAQTLIHDAHRLVAAGVNAMTLKREVEQATAQACDALRRQSLRMPPGKRGQEILAGAARAMCADEQLADHLIRATYMLGGDGNIEVMHHEGRDILHEYLEGSQWKSAWHSAAFATDKGKTIARMEDASLVILDGKLNSADSVIEAAQTLNAAGLMRVALVLDQLSDEAMIAFNQLHHRGVMQIALVKLPTHGAARSIVLEDLSMLTGARVIVGDDAAFARLRPDDCGFARRLWVNNERFGVIGGRRDVSALRRRIENVRREIESTNDLERLPALRERLGCLTSSAAILRIGGALRTEAEMRQQNARRFLRVFQSILRGGVVLGGGAALLECSRVVSKVHSRGAAMLSRALEKPFAVIAENAGADASDWLAHVKRAGAPLGFEARTATLVNLAEKNVFDATAVVERAIRVASSLAVTVMTTDAVVHHRNPQAMSQP